MITKIILWHIDTSIKRVDRITDHGSLFNSYYNYIIQYIIRKGSFQDYRCFQEGICSVKRMTGELENESVRPVE